MSEQLRVWVNYFKVEGQPVAWQGALQMAVGLDLFFLSVNWQVQGVRNHRDPTP